MLAVLVQSHAEDDIIAEQPVIAGYDIGRNLLEGMADMWFAVRVIDGGGDVKGSAPGHELQPSGDMRTAGNPRGSSHPSD
jgi:hypothetical protein